MDSNTLRLIVFAEQLAALAAKTIFDLKGVLTGASSKTTVEILDDADSTYNQIITDATRQLPAPVIEIGAAPQVDATMPAPDPAPASAPADDGSDVARIPEII